MENKNLLVLKSSAGSGKTFALVRHYLLLALKHSGNDGYYRHILAITFTNAAAAEMKERVLLRLEGFSREIPSPADASLLLDLERELAVPVVELQQRARRVYTHMLHHYGQISISTIDSFTHRIIRAFARDLRLHPDFSVELDSESLLAEVVDNLLDEVGTNPELTDYLERFVLGNVEDERNWNVRQVLLDFSKNLLHEEGAALRKEVSEISLSEMLKVRDNVKKANVEYEQNIQQLALACVAVLEQAGLGAEALHNGSRGIWGYYHKVAKGEIELPTDAVRKNVLESKWIASKLKGAERAQAEAVVPALGHATAQLFEALDEGMNAFLLRRALLSNIYITGLLGMLSKLFEQLKEEQNVLLISDFHRIVAKVVLESSAPFIYERVGEKYNHILFDEFQDTSELQWTNFIPLLENSLSRGHFNLVVGDGKQSIYRWRNGKVEQFVDLPEITNPQADGFVRQVFRNAYREGNLQDNYRSATRIIDFNNGLYTHMAAWTGDWEKVYHGGEQNSKRTLQGMVQVKGIFGKDKEDRNPQTVAWVVEKVKEALHDGYRLKDIAILTRKKEGQLDVIAQALQSEKLNVVTSESFLLMNSPKVRWMMSCLHYIMNPEQAASQMQLIADTEYLFGGKLTKHEWWPKYATWDKRNVELNMPAFFENHWQELPSLTSFPDMLHLFAGQLAKATPGGEDEYTECLLMHLHQKVVQENETLSAILQWFSDKQSKLYVSATADIDGVQIMTIHKSKGLQFPVVIYPCFMSKPLFDKVWVSLPPSKYGIPAVRVTASSGLEFLPEVSEELSKQKLDALNVCYVATTRAEDRLYFGVEVNEKANTDQMNDVLWRYVQSLEPENTSGEIVFGNREVRAAQETKSTEQHEWNPLPSLHQVPDIQIRFSDRAYLGQDMQRKGGDFVHECLSVIRTAAESEEVINQLSKLRKPLLDNVDYWANVARSVVRHEQLSSWFSGHRDVVLEHDLVTPDGKWLRPDRMRLTSGAYAILDFKTGAESEEHHEQLREYKRALSVATREEVTAHLFYTLTGSLVEVV
jgi:ATP-dependent exoDNAse (exonuclease V) beta subunit